MLQRIRVVTILLHRIACNCYNVFNKRCNNGIFHCYACYNALLQALETPFPKGTIWFLHANMMFHFIVFKTHWITWTIPPSVTTYDIRFPFSLAFFFPFISAWKLYLVEAPFSHLLTSSSSFFFFSLTFWTSLASMVFGFFDFSSSSS